MVRNSSKFYRSEFFTRFCKKVISVRLRFSNVAEMSAKFALSPESSSARKSLNPPRGQGHRNSRHLWLFLGTCLQTRIVDTSRPLWHSPSSRHRRRRLHGLLRKRFVYFIITDNQYWWKLVFSAFFFFQGLKSNLIFKIHQFYLYIKELDDFVCRSRSWLQTIKKSNR